DPLVTATTTRWPKRSTAPSRLSSCISTDRGAPAPSSNTVRSTGSTGTTHSDCTARSVTSHPSNTKPTGTVTTPACYYPKTNQPALHKSRGGSPHGSERDRRVREGSDASSDVGCCAGY